VVMEVLELMVDHPPMVAAGVTAMADITVDTRLEVVGGE